MRIMTWNIQWGRGCDGHVDLARIAKVISGHAPDVVCLQEVAVHHEGLPGAPSGNQPKQLAGLLNGLQWAYAPGSDLPDGQSGRRQFGNMVLSRWPLLQILRYQLPWPADASVPSMPRVALEATVDGPCGPVRIVTTHLEFYSRSQRRAQVEALRGIQESGYRMAKSPPNKDETDPPFTVLPRGEGAVFCGDFNCSPASEEYALMQEGLSPDVPRLMDAWRLSHPDQPHPPTTGIVTTPWLPRPVCFDFFFVSADLAQRVRNVQVDVATEASDHQPVLLEMAD